MKLKTKILFGILGGAVLATVPVAVLASCSSSDTKVSLYAGQALNNVKENMLIKHKAAWTDINDFDDTKLEQVLRTNEIQPFNNYGYTTSVKLVQPYPEKGEVEVEIMLSKGGVDTKYNHTFTGFLTTAQKANNQKLDAEIKQLTGIQDSGEFSVTTNVEDANKALDKNISKNINELYDATKDNGLLLKNNSVQGLDTPGKVKTTLGIEFPVIQKNVYVEKEVDGTKVRSSEFLLEVKGFTKELTQTDVEKLIELGSFSKTNELAKISANDLNTDNLSNYFQDLKLTNNGSSSLDSTIFPNIENIEVKPIKVISTNEQEGFATVEFGIKMNKNDANAQPIKVQKNIFGFFIKLPEWSVPKTINGVSAIESSTVDFSTSSNLNPIDWKDLNGTVSTTKVSNKFIKVTLPTKTTELFGTDKYGYFTPKAVIDWKIKDNDPNVEKFILNNNIINNKDELNADLPIKLIATINEEGIPSKSFEITLNFSPFKSFINNVNADEASDAGIKNDVKNIDADSTTWNGTIGNIYFKSKQPYLQVNLPSKIADFDINQIPTLNNYSDNTKITYNIHSNDVNKDNFQYYTSTNKLKNKNALVKGSPQVVKLWCKFTDGEKETSININIHFILV